MHPWGQPLSTPATRIQLPVDAPSSAVRTGRSSGRRSSLTGTRFTVGDDYPTRLAVMNGALKFPGVTIT
ncbi:hypothetical protein Rrhod_2908 [Rhodococcus rhodnii LMG 5362]|uniref:Uncharacterized protein n=1 Tax=Rhodococcus rhodnii LMG 5362 TaxID=1273125 RepID=R7WKC5_9NOCA|nr:hypothetical protein Rrhod_2908 [Rhodococcus rhodnii LMG 5362]